MRTITRRAAIAAASALAGLAAMPGVAAATHGTCVYNILTPWPVTESGNVVKAKGAAEMDCASGTTGRLYVNLTRERWWGWEKVASADHGVDNYGNTGLIGVTYWCNGDGTFTYQVTILASIYHPGAGPQGSNYVLAERAGNTNRFSC